MQLSYAALVSVLASAAYAQTIASEVALLPSCALTCLTTGIAAAGCGLTDYACQCGPSMNAISKSATPCIAAACSTSDTLNVQKITAEICVLQAASGGSASSSVPASVESSASSVAESATSVAATSVSSVASSISSAASSAGSSIHSSIASSASAASSAETSKAASVTSKPASTSAPASTSSTPAAATANVGNQAKAMGGMVAGAAAVAAFLL